MGPQLIALSLTVRPLLAPAPDAGMPVVLNQLLSDRRPAAQALLRELLLNADGTLRSDATTQQILQARGSTCCCPSCCLMLGGAVIECCMWPWNPGGMPHGPAAAARHPLLQVWLAAADQAAAVATGDTMAAGGSGGRSASLVGSLAMAGPAAQAAADPAAAADAGLDLAALLLDGRNAPLRRIAMDANPAKTISSMPPAMRQQLKDVSTLLLGTCQVARRHCVRAGGFVSLTVTPPPSYPALPSCSC